MRHIASFIVQRFKDKSNHFELGPELPMAHVNPIDTLGPEGLMPTVGEQFPIPEEVFDCPEEVEFDVVDPEFIYLLYSSNK